MPAENHDSDFSSLNWEEFFGSSTSEDILPYLLGIYDSIVAARKSNDDRFTIDSTENSRNTVSNEVLANSNDEEKIPRDIVNDLSACFSELKSTTATPSSDKFCYWSRGSSTPTSSECENNFQVDRPCSIITISSVSSRSSVSCSDSINSDDNIVSQLKNGETTNQKNLKPDESLPNEFLNSSVEENIEYIRNTTETSYLKNNITTASQYSEDSGIYSSLMRPESLHERSWFYATEGEYYNYTNRVIVEILETECVYVNDLQEIITGYLDVWKSDSNCPLSSEQINNLFGNIEEIYNFNSCFLWELEQCGLNNMKIARCFVENNSNFSIYASYCTHYPKSMNILTELMRQEGTADIFRERQISLHHTLPLGSYLLKPVQRILKYHLLLRNMVKHMSPDIVGYNDITAALSTMTGIAHHINTMKRQHEHAIRVQEVQSLLNGWQGPDLNTFGELYAECSFRISNAKAYRHIFLFEHMLLVTKKKKDAAILNYKMHILCSNLMLIECIPKEPLSFQIIPFDNPRLQFTIHARSFEEKRYWTLELKRVILENYNVNIPSHARQLVMELGQIQRDENVAVRKLLSSNKRPYFTPEYLGKKKLNREKRVDVKSRLLPLLFKKLHTAQNIKTRREAKKNQFASKESISSKSSLNSDNFCSNDDVLTNSPKTTDDFSRNNEKVTQTIGDCGATTENCSPDRIENALDLRNLNSNSYKEKEKLIEEIIDQLLIASRKFQKAIKNHSRHSNCENKRANESYNVDNVDETDDDEIDSNDRRYSKNASQISKNANSFVLKSNENLSELELPETSCESLPASLKILMPTSPDVWLKEQKNHLVVSQKKSDSLPHTFQISTEDEWRANRPKTLDFDKSSHRYENNDIISDRFVRSKKSEITPPATADSIFRIRRRVHPKCKFYRTSVAKMTLRKMVCTIGVKLLIKHRRNERSYKIDKISSKYENNANECFVGEMPMPIYKQGSSDLGARIANGQTISDYADPKVLFPTITDSKKAASVLGIRAYSTTSSPKTYEHNSEGNADEYNFFRCKSDSDSSISEFYGGKFEEVKTQFENACNIGETSPFKNSSQSEKVQEIRESFRKYSRFNVHISVHKLIKIPPPVPIKPVVLKNSDEQHLTQPVNLECNSPTRGWVKQIVHKFQSELV